MGRVCVCVWGGGGVQRRPLGDSVREDTNPHRCSHSCNQSVNCTRIWVSHGTIRDINRKWRYLEKRAKIDSKRGPVTVVQQQPHSQRRSFIEQNWMKGWQYSKGLTYVRPIFGLTQLAFLRANRYKRRPLGDSVREDTNPHRCSHSCNQSVNCTRIWVSHGTIRDINRKWRYLEKRAKIDSKRGPVTVVQQQPHSQRRSFIEQNWMKGWQYSKGLTYVRPIFGLTQLAFLRANRKRILWRLLKFEFKFTWEVNDNSNFKWRLALATLH